MLTRRCGLKLDDVPEWSDLYKAIKRGFKVYKKGKYKIRDLCLVAIPIFTGCRFYEIFKLTKADVNPKSKTIRIPRIRTKGLYRVVKIEDDLFWEIMNRYLKEIKNESEKLFKFNIRWGRDIVSKFTMKFLKRKVRPYAIRHSYAIKLLKNGVEKEKVIEILGYSKDTWVRSYISHIKEDPFEKIRFLLEK